MRPEEIDAVLNREPFQPVRFHLSDGRMHDVVDAGTAHVGSDTIVLGVYDTGTRFPRWRLLSLAQITEVEPLTPAQLG
jgi:hypothetical protein